MKNLSSSSSILKPKIVRITPPKISFETIQQEVVCTRPMREGRFNISVERGSSKKLIVNCLGHGGAGWTTLFGSVDLALQLFESEKPNKDTPIRVIGSGCMGLTSAIELARRGYRVAGITTKSLYDITSWSASGYFAFVSVKTNPEEQENLNQLGEKTYLTYLQIDKGEHPYISREAVHNMPVYASKGTETGLEDLEKKGIIQPREYVTLDFGNGVVHTGYIRFMTYFMNTTLLMRQLTSEVKRLGIPIEMGEIKTFEDVKEEIIFNCSGLGGRELNHDTQIIPVRGHLLILNEKAGIEHMNYMIYTAVEQEGKEEYIYMFPKNVAVTPDTPEGTSCKGVLGGTFIPYVDRFTHEEQIELDRKEFKKLYERNSSFFLGFIS